MTTDANADPYLSEEPPTGSVVVIGWGDAHQEVWVSNQSNLGNWYCLEVPFDGSHHPTWYDVSRRAEGRTLTLLEPAAEDAYKAGYAAGISAAAAAIEELG